MSRSGLFAASLLSLAVGVSAVSAREIDNHGGIFFFCKPLADEAWTMRACEDMAARRVALAAAVQKPLVVLKVGDTREKYPGLAKTAGFDSSRAVWFLITIEPHAQTRGQWELAARADASRASPPGGQPQVVTYSRRATAESSGEVAGMGNHMLSGLMLVLAGPGRSS